MRVPKTRLLPRKRLRPTDATGQIITGGAGGFHLPQVEGRTSYLTRKVEAQLGGRRLAVAPPPRPISGKAGSEGPVKWCKRCSREHPSRAGCGLISVAVEARSGRMVRRYVHPGATNG